MTGRPSTYSEDIAARICAEMAEGKSIRAICRADDMPGLATVFGWLARHKTFAEQYARAQQDRIAAWAEELVDIADEPIEDVQRSRLKVDTRKWLMSKLAPKKYGDRLVAEHTGPNGGPIQTVDLTNATDDDLARLEALLGPVAGATGGAAEADQGGEGEEGGGS